MKRLLPLLLALVIFTAVPQPTAARPPSLAYQAESWVYTGGPLGGLGYDVRIDPRSPDVMYVTDAFAGVFKSTDGGQSWFPANNGITTRIGGSGDAIPIFSLTIDPNNSNRLWVGTEFLGGIFRSDDAGANWQQMSNGIQEQSITIRGFGVEPGNSDVVYMAGEISSWEWNNGQPLSGLGMDKVKGVVYKTVDAGQHWERIWAGDNLARYVLIDPQNPDLLYVSTGIFDREAANSDHTIPDPGGVGILRSRDGGQTWEVLGPSHGFSPEDLYLGSLSMNPENPKILLAAAGNDPFTWYLDRPMGAVYRTEDGGDTWTKTLDLAIASAVEICAGDPDVVYASSVNGFYRSEDGGLTWEEMTRGMWGPEEVMAGFPIDMACDPRNPQRIFVNNYGGGNFLSEDGGATWTVASRGYTGALMRQVAVAPDDPAHVYASARSGIFVSKDGGENWQGISRQAARPMEALALAVDPTDANHLLATVLDGGPVPKISEDGGQSWVTVSGRVFPGGLRAF